MLPRLVPVAFVLLLLGAALPATVTARNQWFEVQLSGPGFITAGQPGTFEGQVVYHSGPNLIPAALALQDVRLMLDGATIGHATTNAVGAFSASLTIPTRGIHWLTASIDLLDADSPTPLRVVGVVPPQILTLTGIQSTRWNYSHIDWTLDDGGYPPFQFRVYRSTNGGPFSYATGLNGFARSFEERVTPGTTFTYRVEAANFAGASAPMSVTDSSPTAPADSLTAAMDVAWACECSPGNGGWWWGYGTGAAIQSNRHFSGASTLTGQVTSLGAAADRRVVTVAISGWVTNYCYPDQPCVGDPVYPRSQSAQATVASDGSYSVTFPPALWTWSGGADATATAHLRATITIDALTATQERTFALQTDPCAVPNPPCGGGF